MTFGSLFAGIGGMDLGLERAGMECRWQVEIDSFCSKVLEKHWPHIKRYGDITTIDATELERVDVIAGGFPCQDISHQGAVWGERAGLEGTRSGLWWEMLRTIRVVRPKYVIVENVAALLGNGMGEVIGSLAEIGYDSEWDCLPASAFGAPHERDRVFMVANDGSQRMERIFPQSFQGIKSFPWFKNVRSVEDVRDRPDLPEPLFRGSGDGIPEWMDRLKSLGNSVVPQVSEWVGRQIIELNNSTLNVHHKTVDTANGPD